MKEKASKYNAKISYLQQTVAELEANISELTTVSGAS